MLKYFTLANGAPTHVGGIRTDLSLQPGVQGVPAIQLLPNQDEPLPLSSSPTTASSTFSTSFFCRALSLCAYDNAPAQATDQLQDTFIDLVRRGYISNAPAIGNHQPRREMDKIDLLSFRIPALRRGRTFSSLFSSLAVWMLANWRSMMVNTFPQQLNLWLQDMVRGMPGGNEQRRKDMLERLQIWLTPAFIKNHQNQHTMTVGHPLFRTANGGFHFSFPIRRWIVQQLRYLFPLLVYIVDPLNTRVQNIGPAPIGVFTAWNARTALFNVQGATTWTDLIKENHGIQHKLSPALRYIQRSRYHMNGMNPMQRGEMDGSLLTPFPTRFHSPRFHFDVLTIITFIIPALLHPLNGRAPIDRDKLLISSTEVCSQIFTFRRLLSFITRRQDITSQIVLNCSQL